MGRVSENEELTLKNVLDNFSQIDFSPHFIGHQVYPGYGIDVSESVFELRYEVYCLDCKFLSAQDYPDRRELDSFDNNCTHFCATNLAGHLVGYVRLVRPDISGYFPFEYQGDLLFSDVTLPPRKESGEVSRLMVRLDYRRRAGDLISGSTDVPEISGRRSSSPQILLAMYKKMYQQSLASGIRYWYAAMEKPLARILNRMNFSFKQLGPECDYYGPVALYVADLRELEKLLEENNPELLYWMKNPEKI